MGFISVNEMQTFSFEDCVVTDRHMAGDAMEFSLDALIIKANNSQNSQFTDSYAADAVLRLEGFSMTSLVKAGCRKYDANDVLVEEIPDAPATEAETKMLTDGDQGCFLYEMSVQPVGEEAYEATLSFEMPAEIGDVADVYVMQVRYTKARVTWSHYMNRVQR